jgi:hypothetical protein
MSLTSDELEIDANGQYQVIRRRDGWYIVGHGYCIPVNDGIDGLDLIAQLEGSAPGRTWN